MRTSMVVLCALLFAATAYTAYADCPETMTWYDEYSIPYQVPDPNFEWCVANEATAAPAATSVDLSGLQSAAADLTGERKRGARAESCTTTATATTCSATIYSGWRTGCVYIEICTYPPNAPAGTDSISCVVVKQCGDAGQAFGAPAS